MCENCSKTMAKIFLIIVNLIFLLAGLLMLGFSIAALVDPYKFMNFFFNVTVDDRGLNSVLQAIGVFGIILGSIVIIVAFFGFAGATCNSLCLLVMYLILIILILLAEVALVITAAVIPLSAYINFGSNERKDSLIDNFANDINTHTNGTIFGKPDNPWTSLQITFKCCGLNNYQDYNYAKIKTVVYNGVEYNSSVPLSCCRGFKNQTTFIVENITGCSTGNSTNPPCLNLLGDKVQSANKVILGIAAGIVGLELLVIIFTSILIHHLRQEKNQIV